MSSSERLGVAARNSLLRDLVRRYPEAYISAVRVDGIPIEIPAEIEVPPQESADSRRAFFELIVPDDIWPAMDAWDRGRAVGAASVRLRLARDPERYVAVHVIDMTEEHGVYLELVVTEDGSNPWPDKAPAADVRARVGVMRKNSESFILSVDDGITDMLGWSADELIGHRSLEFIDPEHVTVAITSYVDMLRNPGRSRRSRMRMRRADGSWLWIEMTNHNLVADPEHGYVLAEIVDVSEEMAYQEALRGREELLRKLADALPLGVLHVDLDGRVLYRNEQLGAILGNADAPTLHEQFAWARDDDKALIASLLEQAREHGTDADVNIVVDEGPQPRRCTLTLRALKDADGIPAGAVIAVFDVTESLRMREELEWRATTDSLTGCHTRASIMGLLEDALSRGRAADTGTGVIFIDLDRFKHVNDEHGHAVGDAYLAEVARRMLGVLRDKDAVGRIGGDEFLVLCSGVVSSERLAEIAGRIADSLRDDVVLDDTILSVCASIGVAWSRHSASLPDDLVGLADNAMYAVKHAHQLACAAGGAPAATEVTSNVIWVD